MNLRAGAFEFSFPGRPLVMGILNVTPDSFSDGGRYYAAPAAIEHGLRLAGEGADIIDIGGESSRPGAEMVPAEEEWGRVGEVVTELARRLAIPISIDTQKPEVAARAIRAGASFINDVAANRQNGTMWKVAAETGAGYIAMHMQGTPRTMQTAPEYLDVVESVAAFFQDRINLLLDAGVVREQILLDPGIGFGKTAVHNLELLAALARFTKFERPLVLGVSRKSFLGKVLGLDLGARLPAALACACWARQAGVDMIRTHDVLETKQALLMIEAIQSQGRPHDRTERVPGSAGALPSRDDRKTVPKRDATEGKL